MTETLPDSLPDTLPLVRPPAVAGLFYPDEPGELAAEVRQSLQSLQSLKSLRADDTQGSTSIPRALIVPHAGYIYSGPTAGRGYRLLPTAGADHPIRRVALFGPAHRVGFRGIAVSEASAFRTPLGDVPLDRDGIADALTMPGVVIHDAAHAPEHCLEVQLPFLQQRLGSFQLLPFLVGQASAEDVAAVMARVAGPLHAAPDTPTAPDTLLVVSSDLSHYLPYDDACRIDRATVSSLLAGTPLHSHEQACGATPINGLVLLARQAGWRPELIDLCNSGDTAGDRRRVVGYGALAYFASP